MSNFDHNILRKTREALDKAIEEKKKNRSFLASIGPAIIETVSPLLERIMTLLEFRMEDIIKGVENAMLKLKVEINPEIKIPEIKIPEVKIPLIKVPKPEVTVNIPPIKIPLIKVPKPEVTVNIPPIKIPKVEVPKVEFPSDLEISLRKDFDNRNPMPVILMDNKGNPYMAISGANAPRIVDINVINPYTSIADGRRTVTTAGTAVRLTTSSTNSKTIIITALLANTDVVVIGGSGVIAAAGTRTGIPLLPGQAVTLAFNDLTNIWIDSVVNGEGVSFLIMN